MQRRYSFNYLIYCSLSRLDQLSTYQFACNKLLFYTNYLYQWYALFIIIVYYLTNDNLGVIYIILLNKSNVNLFCKYIFSSDRCFNPFEYRTDIQTFLWVMINISTHHSNGIKSMHLMTAVKSDYWHEN